MDLTSLHRVPTGILSLQFKVILIAVEAISAHLIHLKPPISVAISGFNDVGKIFGIDFDHIIII